MKVLPFVRPRPAPLRYGPDPVFPARAWYRAAVVVLFVVWAVAWVWLEMDG